MQIRFSKFLFSLCIYCLFLISKIGISQSKVSTFHTTSEYLGQEETLVASCFSASCLFYNPARLSWQGFDLNLVNLSLIADKNSQDLIESLTEKREISDDFLLESLESYEPVEKFALAHLDLAKLVLPHFAIQGFSNIQANNVPTDGNQFIGLSSRVGFIGGLSLSWGQVSIGISHFRFFENSIQLEPSLSQIEDVKEAIANDSIDSLPFGDFTSTQQGYMEGNNLGLFLALDDEKTSGIGAAVLNKDSPEFKETISPKAAEFQEAEKVLEDITTKYDIEKTLPENLKETVNIGITFGNNPHKNVLHYAISLEKQDLTGIRIENKNTASFRLGLTLPSNLALATSALLETEDGWGIHGGVLGVQTFGGYRANESISLGGKIQLHFGYQRKVSILSMEILGMSTRPINEPEDKNYFLGYSGISYNISLNLLL